MRYFLSILAIFCAISLFAQPGNYFLSHYAPSSDRFDYVCFDMAQDTKGVMYFATKAGILEFNGRDWDLLPSPSAIYSIQINTAGEMYWTGSKGFGKVGYDKHGFQQVEVLSDSSVSDVFQSVIVKDRIFFLTEGAIFIRDEKTAKISTIKPVAAGDTFLKLFELYGVVYANTEEGIFKVDGNKLVPSRLNLSGEVVFFSRIDDAYVVATTDNRIYACTEDLNFKEVHLQDQAYVNASVIVSGSWLNRQLLALGTLRGGVIFINPLNGVTQEITNYATGLPDNEVFEIMADVNHNVWVAHDYGFTKISPYMPLGSFSHYNGLDGNLLCASSFQNTVYVGSSLGLYKLEKVDVYDELVYYEDVPIKEPKKTTSKNHPAPVAPKEEPKTEIKAPSESKKGGLFSFLKRNKSKEKTSEVKPEEKEIKKSPAVSELNNAAPVVNTPNFRRVKRTQKILRSSQFVFKKVQGIEAKITHLVEMQGKLLASGLGGLYEVNNLLAKPLMEEPIRFLYAPSGKDFAIVSTYENEVRVIRLIGKAMENVSLFSNLDDQIQSAIEGKDNELWLCGIDKIYRTKINGSEVTHKQTLDLMHRNTDKTVGVLVNGEILLTNAEGFYHVNTQKNAVEKLDTLPRPSQYFAHNGSIIYHDTHGWNFVGKQNAENNLQLLNVFQNLRFITSDKNPQNFWLISGDNELYKFFGDKVTPIKTEFPVFLKSVVNQDKKIIKTTEILMDQEHSSVRFEVVQPDYFNPQALEFRFVLHGMQEEWSEWSSSNDIIPFPYLPNGEYTLQVQAKNIFGKISELEPLSFEVLPPYWRSSWFYALEFAIFASLVVLSFRLSTRFRIVSRVLSLLTIILLIEFIQTVIGEMILTKNSPVIDFFIQVIVALLVLPVEGYLRNLMLRSMDSSGKIYQFLVPKGSPVKETSEKWIEETSDIDVDK
jgi:hypothetical protein